MDENVTLPDGRDTQIKEYMLLRQHLSKNQYDRLVASVAIAIQRARDNKAPQEVTIRITDKGYPRYIDPTDNHGPVE